MKNIRAAVRLLWLAGTDWVRALHYDWQTLSQVQRQYKGDRHGRR